MPVDAPGKGGPNGRWPALMTIRQLAEFLNRSEASIRRDDREGRIPSPIALGGAKRWRSGEVRAWIRAGCPARSAWEGRWPEKAS